MLVQMSHFLTRTSSIQTQAWFDEDVCLPQQPYVETYEWWASLERSLYENVEEAGRH